MLYACVGNYTENAYFLEELGVHLHSIEELCYFLCENVTGLEDSLMRQELCSFVQRELGLNELSVRLLNIIRNKEGLSAFVLAILKEVSYCSRAELESIEKLLKENAKVGICGRKKLKGDFYLAQGQLLAALREYEAAQKLAVGDEASLSALIFHNMGCVYGRMFVFERAAECFKRAWEIDGNEDSYVQYLAALRIGVSRKSYVDKVVDEGLNQDVVGRLEEKIGAFVVESQKSSEYQTIESAITLYDTGDRNGFENKVLRVISAWKKEYRKNMEVD